MQSQKGFIGLGALVAIVVGLIVIGGGAYYVVHQQTTVPKVVDNNFNNLPPEPQTNPQPSPTAVKTDPKNNPSPAVTTITVTGNDTVRFHSSRQSGTAPLWNQYSWRLGGKSRADYKIAFGDGNSCTGYDCVADVPSPDLQLGTSGLADHQYQSAGTYTARLTSGGATIASATVTVYAGKQGQPPVSMWVTPVSGKVPLVTLIGWDGQDKSVTNYTIDYGDGSTQSNGKCNVAVTKLNSIGYLLQLVIPTAYANTYAAPSCEADHTFIKAGTYIVRLLASDGSVAGTVVVIAKE